jgi:polygalacturonase
VPLKHDDGAWRACDVTSAAFGALGDDTQAIRLALRACEEVLLPAGKAFLTGPLNLTSNQRLVVDGTLLASTDPAAYPMVALATGQHRHSALSLTAIDCYSLGICAVILLPLLSFSVEMTVPPPAHPPPSG